MSKLRVECFSISIDGFGAGPNQSIENPLGIGGLGLHEWIFPTITFQERSVDKDSTTDIDNNFVARSRNNIGAWILGRNMFGPIRGSWPDNNWKGWWGDNPPYHTDVFVLTNYARAPITMEGDTTFHFVTDGIYSALDRAKEAANGLDVRLGGGVSTIHQYLKERLVDELHVAIVPILLGSGEKLFSDINLLSLGYQCVEHVASNNANHIVLRRS